MRPNFVILIADDLGWDDIGAYGNSFIETPNMNRLAAHGLRFDNAFLTTASCSASRGSILTGRYPHSNRSMHLHQGLPAGEVTIARQLRKAGYYTASIGKWHVGKHAVDDFDRVVDERESASGSGRWRAELRRRPGGRPFFFWLAARDPHRPYEDAEADLSAPLDPDRIVLPWGFVDGPGTRRELAQYYREVQRFDHYVGEVVAELDAQGVLDSTLIIVMSDNGRPFHLGKLTLYDEGIKTPLILHWPQRIQAAGQRKQLVSAIDIAPALLELAGLEPGEHMQGRSLLPLLDDEATEIRQRVFAERNWHGRDAHERALRTRQYLYKANQYPPWGHCHKSQFSSSPPLRELAAAHQRGELEGWLADCFAAAWPREELYRIGAEGMEWRNLAAEGEYRAVLESMREELQAWRVATGDRDFEPWNPD